MCQKMRGAYTGAVKPLKCYSLKKTFDQTRSWAHELSSQHK